MNSYNNLSLVYNLPSRREIKPDYISCEITNTEEINVFQKKSAQKAIVWLVSKTPHTIDEIAEHFALSTSLVSSLLRELLEKKIVVRESRNRYKSTVQQKIVNINNLREGR